MAVTVVDTSSDNSGSATTTSFATAFPLGYTPVAGDVCVIFGHLSGVTLTMAIDGNFVVVPGFTFPVAQGSASRMYAWYDVFAGGEGAPTITNSGSVTGGWEMIILRGADPADPFGQVGQATASATSINIASLTGCLAGSVLVADQHARVASGTIPTGFTPDADYGEQEDHATNRATGSANVRMELATRSLGAGGNFGGDTFTVTNGITSSIISLHIEVLAADTEITVNLTRVTESDTARALTVNNPKHVSITRAAETETARTLGVNNVKLTSVTRVVESDTARTLGRLHSRTITRVVDSETARTLSKIDEHLVGIGRVSEQDTARSLISETTEPADVPASFSVSPSRWGQLLTNIDDEDNPSLNLDDWIGQVSASYRFVLVHGVTGDTVGELHPIRSQAPTITHDTTRTTKRTLQPLVLDYADTALVNPVQHRVDVYMTVLDVEYPLGRYAFTSHTIIHGTRGDMSSSTLADEMFILDQEIERGFTTYNTMFGDETHGMDSVETALVRLLRGLPVTFTVEPTTYRCLGSWGPGTNRGQIIDTLALDGDYMQPWFDNEHVLRFIRTFDPATRIPDFNWDTRSVVLRDDLTSGNDLIDSPNRIIVVSNGDDDSDFGVPIFGSYDIPATAPTSISSRGYVIAKTFQMRVPTSAQARRIATNIGQRGLVSEILEATTPPDPRHDSHNVIQWGGENWLEVAWSLPLEPGGEMKHSLRKAYT